MNALSASVADYLMMRRALGYRLVRTEKLLEQFTDFLTQRGATTVTLADALDWARLPAGAHPSWWANRLSVVRSFASYLHTLDPATQVPPRDLLPSGHPRACPYLYTEQDITALLEATDTLRWPLRAATYRTLVALLAVTGMRVGEAIGLDRSDIDLGRGLLVVRQGKFGKSRELPLHPSTTKAIGDYLRVRDRLCPQASTPATFISTAGTRLLYCNVHWTWQRLTKHAGLVPRTPACRPRIHDLRHSFAVRSLLDAYATGEDGQRRLTLLSTYLGHVDPAGTYWYLSASPELLALAGQRLEQHLAGRS